MLSKDLQDRIRASYEGLKCFRAVARIFSVNHITVKRVVQNLHKGESSRAGAPKKTTKRDECNIKRAAAKIGATGQRITARKVQSECNLQTISLRTMQNRLKDLGMKFGKASRKIVHTKAHKETRLAFARAALTDPAKFSNVIWTDEKRFNSDGPDSWHSWMPAGKPIVRNRRQQGGPAIQVWGMLIPGPLLVVFELPPRGDSTHFMAFMEEQVLPAIRELVGDDFVLQQDRAPTHTSAYSMGRFADLGVELLDWPSRSPDLNLIENCWSMISNIVYDGKQYESANDLWGAIDSAVSYINAHKQEALNNIFASLPRRFLECVELKGGLTHY